MKNENLKKMCKFPDRHRPGRLFILHFSFFIFHFALFTGATAQERNVYFNEEQQGIEQAKYLHRIEADADAALARLQDLMQRSQNEEIQTQASFAAGRILEERGNRDLALDAYRSALAGKGLQAPEKL